MNIAVSIASVCISDTTWFPFECSQTRVCICKWGKKWETNRVRERQKRREKKSWRRKERNRGESGASDQKGGSVTLPPRGALTHSRAHCVDVFTPITPQAFTYPSLRLLIHLRSGATCEFSTDTMQSSACWDWDESGAESVSALIPQSWVPFYLLKKNSLTLWRGFLALNTKA